MTFLLSTEFYLRQYFPFAVPGSMAESTVPSHPAEFSDVTCTLRRLTSDPHTYVDECGLNQVSNTRLAVL